MNNMKTVMTVSLALNVILIGSFLGYFVKDSKIFCDMTATTEHKKPIMEEPLYSKLHKFKEENQEIREQIRALRHEVFHIMTAPKFDAESYQSKMEQLHQLHSTIAETMCCKIKDLAVTLNQEQRKTLARFIRKHAPGPKRH